MIAQEQLDIFDPILAKRAKQAGMAKAEAGADVLWREAVRRAIVDLAASGMSFTSDQVWRLAGSPPPGFSSNALGSAFNAAAREGLIRQVGYAKSARPKSHSNLLRLWSGR